MASSSNRFAVLGQTSSSSKEQNTRVPVTSMEDAGHQTVQGTTQAGPSMSMGGLEGSLPHVLTREEKIAIFRKKLLQWEAGEREKERMKKSRQRSNPPTSVGSLIPSAAPSQGLRKRTASSDEAENSPKRRRIGALPSSPAAEEPVTAPSANASEGSPSASAIVIQEDPFLSPPSSFEWSDIRTPKNPLLCIVQVNNSTRIGSFAKDTKEWAFHLTFDASREQVPTMTMKFFSDGIQGPQSAQTGWCLGEWTKEDWMVTNFKIHRVADCAGNGRIRHRHILGACKTDEEKARLVCISLEAWPKILGHFDRGNRWKNPQPGVKKLFSAVLTGRRPYHLRIWFLAPGSLERFEKQCLSIFTLFFHQRKPCYYGIRDVHGVGFTLP